MYHFDEMWYNNIAKCHILSDVELSTAEGRRVYEVYR